MTRRALVIVAAVVLAGLRFPPHATAADGMKPYQYSNEAGSRDYFVYAPTGLKQHAPLMVFLHGCQMTGPQAASETRYNELAEREKFVVVYPEQDPDANGGHCWNWFHPDHQHRDQGEASIIAGITRTVIDRFDIDPRRVFVNGISAGGAMTAVMAATYPDLFAAATIHAGCLYRGFPCLVSASAVPPEVGGEWAYAEMGARARVVPIMVVQGDEDVLVPAINAEQIVQQWLTTDDWVDDGENNGTVSRTPARTVPGRVAGGHSFSVDSYTDRHGCTLVERWLVHGMGHAYAGGSDDGEWTDPAGPDVTTAAYRFSMAHPMPGGPKCGQVAGR